MTLTDFLLQRIAEDERHARKLAETDRRPVLALAITVNHPQRVLAECEAKRRIVETLAIPYIAERRRLMGGRPSWGDENPELLRLLAMPHADHPDFREEWRVS